LEPQYLLLDIVHLLVNVHPIVKLLLIGEVNDREVRLPNGGACHEERVFGIVQTRMKLQPVLHDARISFVFSPRIMRPQASSKEGLTSPNVEKLFPYFA
jgi:hypothetical protein